MMLSGRLDASGRAYLRAYAGAYPTLTLAQLLALGGTVTTKKSPAAVTAKAR